MKTARVPLAMIVPDPEQPRKHFGSGEIAALAENMNKLGQLYPVILFKHEDKVQLCDGERRWRAAKIAGITDLNAIVLPEKPSKAQLRVIQQSIDLHRRDHNPMERSNNLAAIQRETGWKVSELVEQLDMDQSECSKLLACQRLAEPLKARLATGWDIEKAYLVSKIEDHATQLEMVKGFGTLPRAAFIAKLKTHGKSAAKTKRAVFLLAGGASITFKGGEVTLEELIERMTETLKRLRKGLAEGLDAKTVARVFQQKAR